jgi:F420-dependent oxidoreductase-like protein
MKLGLQWGYWGQLPPPNLIEVSQEADRLGFDSVWTAEAWGSDAFSPLAWIAAHTERVRLGTAIVQLSARTPAATAMAAMTIDHLSGGRMILGLGVSGPQVVEGWYGRPATRPLQQTREYVEIIRRILRREEPVEFEGDYWQLPYRGPGATGLGKPLKSIVHPLRTDLPIFLAAEGPKNIAQTVAIADGWLPLYYSPYRQDVYADQLAGAKEGFEVVAMANVTVTDDVPAGLAPMKAALGFYIGGMGAKGQNYHTKLMARMGFEAEALKIQELFFDGKRDEAIAMVPDEFADEISLVGPPARIRDRLAAWKESPVTTLLMYPTSVENLRTVAEIVLSA